jgi:SpoVK/Ycf46/Vps4 family AAA+-type ATPase
MSSIYCRKSDRKLIFTEEILDEARRRIENGESQRKLVASLGTKEPTLRNRLKLVSEHYKLIKYFIYLFIYVIIHFN